MYYIHIDDPMFHGDEFPFGRRLGPFLTEDEAVNQAVSDVAGGFGSVLGIYSEEDSEMLRTNTEDEPEPTVFAEAIDALAEQEREQRLEAAAVLSDPNLEAQWAVLEEAALDPEILKVIKYLKGRTA